MEWRYLDLRRERNRLIFEIQTCAEQAMREYWIENDFIEVHSPKIMGTPSESGAELFKVDTLTVLLTWRSPPSSTSRWRRQLDLNAFSRSDQSSGRSLVYLPPYDRVHRCGF